MNKTSLSNNHPTSVPTGVSKISDGYINITTTGGRIWERCAQAIGAPELVTNPDYAPAPARSKNRDALNGLEQAKVILISIFPSKLTCLVIVRRHRFRADSVPEQNAPPAELSTG